MAVSIVSVQARYPLPGDPKPRVQVTLSGVKADGSKIRKRVECGECGEVFSNSDDGITYLEEREVWLCNECREAGEECEWCGEKYPGALMANYIWKEGGETIDLTVGQHSEKGCDSYWVCPHCHEHMESCSECGRIGHQDDWHYGNFKVLDHEVFCAGCYINHAIRKPENWRAGQIRSLEEIRDIPFGDFEGRCIDGNPEYMVYTTQWFPSMPDPAVVEANLEELNHNLRPLAEVGIEWFMFGDQSTHNVCSVGTNVVIRTEDMAKVVEHMMASPPEPFEPKARYFDGRVNPVFVARHAAELSAMVASGDIGGIQALLDCGGD